jgi:hypothetical protein
MLHWVCFCLFQIWAARYPNQPSQSGLRRGSLPAANPPQNSCCSFIRGFDRTIGCYKSSCCYSPISCELFYFTAIDAVAQLYAHQLLVLHLKVQQQWQLAPDSSLLGVFISCLILEVQLQLQLSAKPQRRRFL